MPRIALIIPAHNEAPAIGAVVRSVPQGVVDAIIVVDNASYDGTGDVARSLGARVIREEQPGYGNACRAGFLASDGYDILVYLDGDRSDEPADLPRILAPLLDGRADLVLGSRLQGTLERGALPAHQRAGNRVATLLVRLLYGVRLSDIGSFRAIRRDDLLALDMTHPTYGWPVEMVVKAARRRYRIVEVPITYHARIGVSKVGGTFRGSVRAGAAMLGTIWRYSRGV
ncbi:MAG: glycosyltransferase family 2 protein [Chloroflexota bacterium]